VNNKIKNPNSKRQQKLAVDNVSTHLENALLRCQKMSEFFNVYQMNCSNVFKVTENPNDL
jgi:hypothetical protein